jgi:hypothetical protein
MPPAHGRNVYSVVNAGREPAAARRSRRVKSKKWQRKQAGETRNSAPVGLLCKKMTKKLKKSNHTVLTVR